MKCATETKVLKRKTAFQLSSRYLSSFAGVDTSMPALEFARENVMLNNLDHGRISFLREDATEFMKGAVSRGESWDIVVLDPPKLAPNRKVSNDPDAYFR